jgi:cysteine-rich repeat protein
MNRLEPWNLVVVALAALTVLVVHAVPAYAVCGDGVLDVGELCDDGNTADGDCCTSTCDRPTGCIATNRAAIILRDRADDRDDKIFWKYLRAETTFEDFGDPLTTAAYSFCIWDDDELKLDARIDPGGLCYPARPCWKIVGRGEPRGYKYFEKPANDDGMQYVLLFQRKRPAAGYITLRAIGTEIDPPGPIGFDQYFNQNSTVTVQFVRGDAPVCWESVFTTNNKNDNKRFRAHVKPH